MALRCADCIWASGVPSQTGYVVCHRETTWGLVGEAEWCSEHQQAAHPVYEVALFSPGDIPEEWEPIGATTIAGFSPRIVARHILRYE